MITAGIDCGAKNTKTVILRGKEIIGKGLAQTGFDQSVAIEKSLEAAIQDAGTENRDLIIKYLDLDIGRVGVITVDNSIEQHLTHGRKGVSKTLLALQAAVKRKSHTDMRYNKCHRLLYRLEQGIGDLAIINNHTWGFKAADMDMIS